MRLLVIHNYYRSSSPSGENQVVDDQISGLRSRGIDVAQVAASSDELLEGHGLEGAFLKAASIAGPVRNPIGESRVKSALAEHRPHVVHVHNLNPIVSPHAIKLVKEQGIPVVSTVHNYRRRCVKGSFYRDGRQCRSCDNDRFPIDAIRFGCYRSSRLQSASMAVGQHVHRKTWGLVDKHLVLTAFAHDWLVRQGIPSGRISVLPTAVSNPGPTASSPSGSRDVVFVGRVDEEKGVDLLVSAWSGSRLPSEAYRLTIIGTGPLDDSLRSRTSEDVSVSFVGRLQPSEVHDVLRACRLVVVPSRWLEGFPRVVAEAFSYGRPVVAVNNENMRTVVGGAGWLADDLNGLGSALNETVDDLEVDRRGRLGRDRFDAELDLERQLDRLIETYEMLCGEC